MSVYSFFHPDLTHDKILKSVIAFTIPLVISWIFQQLYNAVDTVIVGHFLGEKSLAAIGSCAAITELLIGFGNGFGGGLGIVAARYFGACNVEKLKKVTAGSIIITICVTAFIMISGHFFLKPLLRLLGTPESILDEAHSYIWTIAIFSGVLFAYNLLSGLLRAIGNSFMPLVFLIVSSVLNVILDIIFVKNFGMGVRGTAIATVFAQGISAVFCLIYIVKKATILLPKQESFHVGKNLYKDLTGQGLSMALMSALVSSGSVILQSAINSFDTMIMAGHISARKVFAITDIPLITLGISSSTFVSQNLGANKKDRILKGVRAACILCVAWGVLCTATIPFASRTLIKIVSGSKNPGLIDFGAKYISFMQPFYAVLGILVVSRNSLQGLGSKLLPLISSIIELLGKMLFTWIIIPLAGTWGIIMCEPLIWVVMTIQLVWVYEKHPIIKEARKEIKSKRTDAELIERER